MRLIRRIAAVAAAVLAPATVIVAAAAPAFATPTFEICNTNGYCLNARNGGPYVQTWSAGQNNNNFVVQYIEGRCARGSELTTANCPWAGTPAGIPIFQFYYLSTGNCAGDFNNDPNMAELSAFDACNSTTSGTGGAYGTVQLQWQGSCASGYWAAINVHSSSGWGSGTRFVSDGGHSGNGYLYYANVISGLCLALRNN